MKALLGPFPPGGTLTPGGLSDVYKYGFKEILAHDFAAAGASAPTKQTIQIGARPQRFNVQTFAPNEVNEMWWVGANRDFPLMDYTDPQMRIYYVWFQSAGAKPVPDEFVVWEGSIGIIKNGETYNFSMEITPGIQNVPSLVQGQWVHSGCGANGDEAIILPVGNFFGPSGTLAANEWNSWIIEVERPGIDGNDTFNGDAHFLKAIIQYKTNFNNDDQWPTSP